MTCLVVFGREPVAGSVKTRLARGVGPSAAAAVYRVLLETTVRTALEVSSDVVLSLADEPSPRFAVPEGARLEVQGAGDLGARMREAFDRRFSEGHGTAAIVGSDCPELTADHLRAAADALQRAAVVLGPAGDGGYWLVGQRVPGIDLFSGVPWSSPETLAATRARLGRLGADWRELEMLDDIDTAEDLEKAVAGRRVPAELVRRLERAVAGGSA